MGNTGLLDQPGGADPFMAPEPPKDDRKARYRKIAIYAGAVALAVVIGLVVLA